MDSEFSEVGPAARVEFTPRAYQKPVLHALEAGVKRVALVWQSAKRQRPNGSPLDFKVYREAAGGLLSLAADLHPGQADFYGMAGTSKVGPS